HNPFIDNTRRILAGVAPAQVSAPADEGEVTLTLEEAIVLALVARHIAASDGLSQAESNAMRGLLEHHGVPEALHPAVMDADLRGAADEHVSALVPARSAKALHLISGVSFIAARDGLSAEERGRVLRLATALGIERPLVDALIAESEAAVLASVRGDAAMLTKLDRLREALFRLV
ncbi:MAG TPA: hypothetical protein PKW35_23420, partial [Nannocystaceae bacterium]|nr:hypothetical protein [Nannocystaceae bacterium]